MELEYLKIGRVYRVKQGRKLLVLRLKEIQTLKGIGTDLYELKITTEGYRLWMLDEHIGKGYTITNLSQIDSEIPEKPVEGSLVQIVKGVLLKSLGSVTVYRVKSVGVDEDTNKRTVTLYGPFKNYVCWMDDVRVYEGKKVDPETLLSKESKKIGDMPKRFLPGPAVPTKTKLSSFLRPPTAFGSLTGEEKKTKEDLDKEKLQADLDKKKEEYAAQQHSSSSKKTPKQLKAEADAILKRGEVCQPEDTQDDQSQDSSEASSPESNSSRVKNVSSMNGGDKIGSSSSKTRTHSSTDNTASPQSSQKPAKSTTGKKPRGFVPTPSQNTRGGQTHRNQLGGIESRQPKARKEKLAQAIKKNSSLRVKGRNKATEERMPLMKEDDSEDEQSDSAISVTVQDSQVGYRDIPALNAQVIISEEDEDSFDARVHKKVVLEAPVPEHLNGIGESVKMKGLEIDPEYWKDVERRKEEDRLKKKGRKK